LPSSPAYLSTFTIFLSVGIISFQCGGNRQVCHLPILNKNSADKKKKKKKLENNWLEIFAFLVICYQLSSLTTEKEDQIENFCLPW